MEFLKKIFGGETKYQNLTNEDFQSLLKATPKPVIIDVRSRTEFADIKIPNALNLDIMNPNFANRISHMDKDKTYFVYCQSGRRSAKACKKMVKAGFENIINLKGGIVTYTGRTV